MDMTLLQQNIQSGLSLGVIYAVVAIGYNLTFGVLKIANLAFGALLTIGAFAALNAYSGLGLPFLAAMAAGVGAAAFVGLLVHFLAVAPLGEVEQVDSPRHVAVLVSTLGASIVLEHLVLTFFGPYPRRFVLADEIISRTGINQTPWIATFAGLAVLGGLALMLKFSSFGWRIRALAADRGLAKASGIDVRRDQILCVLLSGALAGFSGVLVGLQYEFVSPQVGFGFGMKGLVALIVGRSMLGSALVGLALGLSEALVTTFLSSSYRDLVVYLLLIVALFVRRENKLREMI